VVGKVDEGMGVVVVSKKYEEGGCIYVSRRP